MNKNNKPTTLQPFPEEPHMINAASFSLPELGKWHRKASSKLGIMTEDLRIIVCGYDILKELVQTVDLGQAIYLFIKHRLPEKRVSDLLKCIIVGLNYPDIRIWPIAAVALAGASGANCGAALSAGILGFESTMLGVFAISNATCFLDEIQNALDKGVALRPFLQEWLKSGKTAYGYGRPVFKTDERVPAVLKAAQNLGFGNGKWLSLALEIEKILGEEKKLIMNYGGLIGPLFKDIGFTRQEVTTFSNFLPIINFLGVFHEHAYGKSPIFPLSCQDVEYSGPPPKD